MTDSNKRDLPDWMYPKPQGTPGFTVYAPTQPVTSQPLPAIQPPPGRDPLGDQLRKLLQTLSPR